MQTTTLYPIDSTPNVDSSQVTAGQNRGSEAEGLEGSAATLMHSRSIWDPIPDLIQYPVQPSIRHLLQYIASWSFSDGTSILIRPIRPDDEPLAAQFHKTLSERSVYLRYFHWIKLSQRITHEWLMQLCQIDYDRDITLVADYDNPTTGTHELLAFGHLYKLLERNEAEFALLVSDAYQGLGLGSELLRRLLQIGRDRQFDRVVADILPENTVMQHICQRLGFQLERTPDGIRARIDL